MKPAIQIVCDVRERRRDRTCDHCCGTGRIAPTVVCRPCGGSGWERTWEDFVRAAKVRAMRRAA